MQSLKKPAFVLLGLIIVCGCQEKQAPIESLLVGQWRRQERNVHTILDLKSSRKWFLDVRIEGVTTRIIKKKGTAKGTWQTDKAQRVLKLVTLQPLPAIGWHSGDRVYHVAALDPLNLHLIDAHGHNTKWKKVRSHAEGATNRNITSIHIAPVLVSMKAGGYPGRHRWICADIALVMGSESHHRALGSEIRERIIFYFSSKTYGEINTQEKLKTAREELKLILNPYLNGELLEVDFNKFTVTGRKDAVNRFLAEYKRDEADPAAN